jgi:2-polyprenyl-3-methyl-5-hydroxy-6-metoxy-1,4-benzoquinol methylase
MPCAAGVACQAANKFCEDSMKLIKKEFDRHYHENIIYQEHHNSQRNQKRLELLLEQRQLGHLLEIGCGTGGFLRLAEQHFDVECIDISKYAIESIRPHFGERVKVHNVELHPLPKEQYDVVVAYNILEHLRHPQKVVERIFNSLKTGGLMIGSVPNNQRLVGGAVTQLGNFFDRTHISTFSPSVWERIFTHAGFQQVSLFGEINLGRNHCAYLRGPNWPHFSFNLMFTCKS